MRALTVLLVMLCAMPAALRAAPGDELQTCLANNTPKRSSVLSLALDSKDRAGHEFRNEGRVYWKRSEDGGSRSLICLTAPADVRGLAYLIHEGPDGRAVWVYLPEEERVLRYTPRSAARRARIHRTALSYEDLRYLPLNYGRFEARLEAKEALSATQDAYHVQLSAAEKQPSEYGQVNAVLERESCMLIEADLYDTDTKLRKRVEADPASMETRDGLVFARSIRVRDLKQEIETQITVKELKIDPELSESIFTAQHLVRRQCP